MIYPVGGVINSLNKWCQTGSKLTLSIYSCSMHLRCKPVSNCRLFGSQCWVNASEINARVYRGWQHHGFKLGWPVCSPEFYLNRIWQLSKSWKIRVRISCILYSDLFQTKPLSPLFPHILLIVERLPPRGIYSDIEMARGAHHIF